MADDSNQQLDETALATLNQASWGFQHLGEVAEQLPHGGPSSGAHGSALRAGLRFTLCNRKFKGHYSGDMDDPWPEDLDGVPDHAKSIWAIYADKAEHPGIRAHLHHLLMEVGHGKRHEHARAAAEAYLRAAGTFCTEVADVPLDMAPADALLAGLDLAKRMKFHELVSRAMDQIVDLVDARLTQDQQVDSAQRGPGVVIDVLEPLVAAKDPRALERLKRAADVYRDDPEIYVQLLDMAKPLVPEADKRVLDLQRIDALVAWADLFPGFLKLEVLGRAAGIASAAGLTDQRNAVLQRMQALPTEPEALGLVPVTVQVEGSGEVSQWLRARVSETQNLNDALWLLAAVPAPAGTAQEAEVVVAEIAKSGSFSLWLDQLKINISGPVIVNPGGTPGPTAVEATWRKLRMDLTGAAVSAALDHIQQLYGPTPADLQALLTAASYVPDHNVQQLATGFHHFLRGEDTAAVYIALPQVEGILREALRARGVNITRLAKLKKDGSVETPGGVSQLGALISEMAASGFDPDWTASLKLLLVDPELGMNLRNDLLHGLAPCPPRHRVALVLQAALYLLSTACVQADEQESHHGTAPSSPCGEGG